MALCGEAIAAAMAIVARHLFIHGWAAIGTRVLKAYWTFITSSNIPGRLVRHSHPLMNIVAQATCQG